MAAELLTLEQAKKHLRVSYDEDDEEIQELILTAEAYIDGCVGAGYKDKANYESEEEYEKRVLDSMKCKGYVNEEPEIIGHLDKSVVNGGELIPGQKSGVVPVAVDKKGLLKKNSGALSTKDFETLIAHTKEKMKECGKAILDGKIEAIPYVYEDNDGCTYCPYGSVCGHESKKDGVREMKKMSDDEVWEALYGDD